MIVFPIHTYLGTYLKLQENSKLFHRLAYHTLLSRKYAKLVVTSYANTRILNKINRTRLYIVRAIT